MAGRSNRRQGECFIRVGVVDMMCSDNPRDHVVPFLRSRDPVVADDDSAFIVKFATTSMHQLEGEERTLFISMVQANVKRMIRDFPEFIRGKLTATRTQHYAILHSVKVDEESKQEGGVKNKRHDKQQQKAEQQLAKLQK